VSGMTREKTRSMPAEIPAPSAPENPTPSTELEVKPAERAAETADLDAELTRMRAYAAGLTRELETTRQELQSMLASTTWRVPQPLRMLVTASPKLAKYSRQLANSIRGRKADRPDPRAASPETGARAGHPAADHDDVEWLVRTAQARAAEWRRLGA